jgi:hypothetical protein
VTHEQAACHGKWFLFDSTELADHIDARRICYSCDAFEWCAERTQSLRGPSAWLEGTWAGRLYTNGRQRNEIPDETREERFAREEELFADPDDLDGAVNAYRSGRRDEWARTGYRVYARRMKRQQVAQRKASVA